ncbi:MAG TPA: phage holin family protein [Streptosporangiaceae bacterium]
MDDQTDATIPSSADERAARDSERSAGELVKEIAELVPKLVREEVKLAQLELTRKGKQAGIGLGMFGGSTLIALYAVGCLLAAAIIGLSGAVAAWLAALIVGVVLLAISSVAALAGRGQLRRATPAVPSEAITSVQADVKEVREKAHR